MKKIILIYLTIISFNTSAQLTVEKIMRDPKWIGTSPTNIVWSYDSKYIYFNWNPDKNISDSVFAFSIATKKIIKPTYTDAQFALAEANGVYNSTKTKLVFIYQGDVFLLELKTNNLKQLTQTEAVETNARFIRNDEWIVYETNNNLFSWNCITGVTQQLTDFKNGEPDAKNKNAANSTLQEKWLQQNQLLTSTIIQERKSKKEVHEAFLKAHQEKNKIKTIYIGNKEVQNIEISPDGRFITYCLVQIPFNKKTSIVPEYVTESGFTETIKGRSKVGVPQNKNELYIIDRKKDTVIEITVDALSGITNQPDYYKEYPNKFLNVKNAIRSVSFGNITWNENGTAAFLDIYSQDNKDKWIALLNAETGKLITANHQHDDAWIDGPGIKYDVQEGWIDTANFYFKSEATGYAHLYKYNITHFSVTPITKGNYEVQEVALSKSKQYFYILTNEEHPGKQNYYRITIDALKKEKLTNMVGGYNVLLSPDEKYIAYRYSYITKPWELYYQENNFTTTPNQITNKAAGEEFKSYAWRETKIFSFMARDNQPVYARLYEPKLGTKNNAAIIFVHGAGYLQNVHYWFSEYYFREQMFNNLLADKGYTILDIDYRGSSGYGRNWRTGIYRHMGGKDLDDEVDAAKYLVHELGIDSTRIGMYGGSYGGFMTLMAMFTTPNVFKAGAALRPVTDWAHYNHGYTSNILNEPFTDSIAYRQSSPIYFADGLKNHLLICHGMIDINVHFQDVVRLTQRLIELGKDNWDLAVYPVESHGFVEPSSWIDEYKRIEKLFDNWLLK